MCESAATLYTLFLNELSLRHKSFRDGVSSLEMSLFSVGEDTSFSNRGTLADRAAFSALDPSLSSWAPTILLGTEKKAKESAM